ncbi:MAG: 6,7-dimethyl-8-ribityllumazine synthase [Pseudomonadota bacterium]|nr:6,7-dimethyl-8-ribityllumazine synthase [Pseudomonadota bacterium]
MTTIKTLEADLLARDIRVVIVAARFNDFVVSRLIEGAIDALVRHGASEKNLELVRVPGAYEMPLVVKKLALTRRYDAIVALGAVIKGDTAHFDFVAGECSSGVARASLDSGVPVGFGVLTCDTFEQAIDRAGGKAGNKGAEAALAALETHNLLKRLDT